MKFYTEESKYTSMYFNSEWCKDFEEIKYIRENIELFFTVLDDKLKRIETLTIHFDKIFKIIVQHCVFLINENFPIKLL